MTLDAGHLLEGCGGRSEVFSEIAHDVRMVDTEVLERYRRTERASDGKSTGERSTAKIEHNGVVGACGVVEEVAKSLGEFL